MKKLIKNPTFYVASWFAFIIVLALMITSCGTTKCTAGFCEAYAEQVSPEYKKPYKKYKKKNLNNGHGYMIMNESIARQMEKNNKYPNHE